MPNQLVRKEDPAIFRNHFHQIGLNFLRVGILRQIEPARKPLHVRIDNDSRRDSEPCSQHDVRCLPRNTRKRENLLHRARHFTAKFFDDLFAGAEDRFRLVAVKTGRADFFFDIPRIRIRKRGRSWVLLEESRSDHVHALIGALRRKNRGGQQLPGVVMLQRAAGGGIHLVERAENSLDALLALGCGLRFRQAYMISAAFVDVAHRFVDLLPPRFLFELRP